MLELVRFTFPFLCVSWRGLLDGDIGPLLGEFSVDPQPLFHTRFGVSLDRIDRALGLAHAAIDALIRVDDEHVLTLVEAIHGADFHTIHQLAFDAALIDDVGQLSVLSADRSGELIRDVRLDPNARKFTFIRT